MDSSKNSPNLPLFSSCVIHIIDKNIIRARMNIFESQIRKYGGQIVQNPSADDPLTRILVDDDLLEEKIAKILSSRFPAAILDGEIGVKVLRTKWLSSCLKQKKLVDVEPFVVHLPKIEEEKESKRSSDGGRPESQERKRHCSSDSVGTTGSTGSKGIYDQTTDEESDEEEPNQKDPSTSGQKNDTPPEKKKPRFACEGASNDPDRNRVNHNKVITDKLKVLAEGYKSTNDKWRALSYEKAIKALSNYPKPISTFEEVRKMRGIGQRLAEKIWEIQESGELRKADEFLHNEKVKTMNLFTNMHGVGPTIAELWYAQGLRTLKDVEEKANLNAAQRIGLKYYDDLLTRMDRSEAEEIVNTVTEAVKKLNPTLICTPVGSFRRGCKTSGDVDIVVTHSDGQSHEGILAPLVKELTEIGFLTDHLVECDEDGDHRRYMGVCKLPGENRKYRRIDILAVPYSEYGTTLVYWTGSAYFVRSINAKAKSLGMRLNQHGLRGGVMRQGGEKLNEGYPIDTPTEESVFEKLGIQYRKPEERDLISFTADL